MCRVIMEKYLSSFLFAFVASLLLTPVIRKIAPILGMVDIPGEDRRIHTKPTPRGGGLAIFLAFHLGFLFLFKMDWLVFNQKLNMEWWMGFGVASGILMLTGLIDDLFGMKALIKLSGQIIAAWVMVHFGANIGNLIGVPLPESVNVVITIFWFLALTNAFNLIDGLDGLATGLGLISAVGLFGVSLLRGMPGEAVVILLLVGACLAFLRYNFHPATIFLGDSGSMFIGFTLASFALETSLKGSLAASLALPFLAMGVPVFDTILAIWRRSLRKFYKKAFPEAAAGGLMTADKEHLHHRILRSGLKQHQVAILLYLVNVVLVAVGVLSQFYKSRAMGIVLIAFLAGVFVVVRHLARTELWDTGRAIITGFHRPAGRVVAFILYPLTDVIVLTLCLLFALKVTAAYDPAIKLRIALAQYFPVWVTTVFLSLVAFQIYQRVWSRSRFGDFLFLAVAIITGCVIGLGLNSMLHPDGFNQKVVALAIIYANLAICLIGGSRLVLRGVQDVMSLVKHSARFNRYDEDAERVLLYGAGGRLALFLREKALRTLYNDGPRIIVGIVDDDRNLRGRLVNGYRVLGNRQEMIRLIRDHAVDRVIVTMECSEKRFTSIQNICHEAEIPLSVWTYDELEGEVFSGTMHDRLVATKDVPDPFTAV
jgi:UDP-GlcNAc:undecaprenyl-phosphate/decaprenyl-phosphate GlcNAc-1-phosphate transferase